MPPRAAITLVALATVTAACAATARPANGTTPPASSDIWQAVVLPPPARGITLGATLTLTVRPDRPGAEAVLEVRNARPADRLLWELREGVCGQVGQEVLPQATFLPVQVMYDGIGRLRTQLSLALPHATPLVLLVRGDSMSGYDTAACGNLVQLRQAADSIG
jgi:hypothetical protein